MGCVDLGGIYEPSHKLSDLATDIYTISKPLGKCIFVNQWVLKTPVERRRGAAAALLRLSIKCVFSCSSRIVEATTNSTILASSRPAYSLPSVKPYLQPHCQFDRDMNWQARLLHVFGL